MKKFRKKPVVIEAVQFTRENFEEMYKFINGEDSIGNITIPIARDRWDDFKQDIIKEGYSFKTLESDGETQKAVLNDWIIKGVHGEFYPCKPDIFIETYEPE